MKILLLGGNGQVGWQLRRSLALAGDVMAPPPRREGGPDLAQPDSLRATLRAVQPALVVNAAAWTAVDRAEDEPAAAHALNATACEVIAAEASRSGAWVVHYSSDYVYDGSGDQPWTETSPTRPLGVYGASKLAGDQALAAGCARHLILRTSWVFDTWGANFLKTILRAAAQRPALTVVNDQWGAPTRAALIADVTAHAVMRLQREPQATHLAGVYHLAAQGSTSWHGYAQLAVAHARACGLALQATPASVQAVPAASYPTRAARPANSRLDTRKLRDAFGIHLPPWEDGVRAVVAELAATPLLPH
ncbi:MAG: dTDP-4-dehydrorhamnose reductase [Proteobacteria bacterium]|nr:dTDP-4-dehydrorhamnose reductase [Pseudomonadota bacterium]